MKSLTAICCAVVLTTAVSHKCRADAAETVAAAERPRVALYAEEVTVDGKPRPDLARALADNLGTALLRRGQVRLFSLESAATQDATGMLASANPAASALRLNRLIDQGLDYVVTFSLIGINGHHVMTVKKLRARTHEVLESRQFTCIGRETGAMKLTAQILEAVDPVPHGRSRIFPRSQSPAEYMASPQPVSPPIVIARALPPGRPVVGSEHASYDPWKQNLAQPYDLSRVPKALVYRHLGTINHVDTTWRFCIIDPVRGTVFHDRDPMHILWEEGDVYASLRVCAVERSGVVLDLGHTPGHHPVFKGDKVYGWAPPLAR